MKEVKEEICEPLTIILQCSIDNRVDPDDWRQANISPIYKKGGKTQTANYRPTVVESRCRGVAVDPGVDGLLKDVGVY